MSKVRNWTHTLCSRGWRELTLREKFLLWRVKKTNNIITWRKLLRRKNKLTEKLCRKFDCKKEKEQ